MSFNTIRSYYYYRGGQGIPESSDALFHLNGVIEEFEGQKYFVDASGNDRNFNISNYDFPSDWTVGFPYKSKATISAPAGDAELIAADINNYLYDSGGTPNQIPVVSLFQDVDYEHKIFTRHVAQTLDANNEELIAPRVAEMVMYNAVRTGDGLTACQSYFSVPTEATSNVKWVSKSGNDTTGTGTKANPWLTLAKATQTATAGDTVYVKTGNYQENHTGATGYWMITRSCTVVGLGRVNVTSANTSFAAFINALVTLTIKNIYLGNDVASSTAIIALSSSFASTLTFDRCWLRNGTYGISAGTSPSITVTNCVYSGTTNRFVASGNTTLNITGCKSTDTAQVYISSATAATAINIKYNEFGRGDVTNAHIVTLNYLFNNAPSLTISGDADVTNAASQLIISYNTITAGSIIVNHNYVDCQILNNYVTATATGSRISVAEQTTLLIGNNRIVNSGGLYSGILCSSTTALAKSYTIYNNTIISDGNNAPITIGDESTTVGYNTVTGRIYGNYCKGSGNAILAHGVTVFNQTGVSMEWNYCEGYIFGYIVKVLGSDLSSAFIRYCVSVNCVNGISAKGGQNQPIYNNTIINATESGLYIAKNDVHNTQGTDFENNIIYEDGAASSYVAIKYDTGSNIVSNNNCIYSLNNSNKFNTGSTNITLSAWQALGYDDTDSIFTDPSLDDSYVPTSPILIGANLGTSADAGLDTSTTWGSSNTVPTIVTRDQQATGDWEIGAYVQR